MKSNSYDEFVEKFKPKKKTDDCYTPFAVYEAVADFVAEEYKLDKTKFARPFFPGGDYKNYDYTDKIVVDNPPFSILAKIIDFYISKNIKFFLFAPSLTFFAYGKRECTIIPISFDVTYENGAKINTSFITNLESSEIIVKTAPKLYDMLKRAKEKQIIKKRKPKYKYPDNLITSEMMGKFSENEVNLSINRNSAHFIRTLESQKELKKTIFGGGFLVSDNLAEKIKAEKIKAEKIKAEKEMIEWQLSEKEKEIISKLK